MNVRTICLAILYDGDSTGYEIRKLSVEGEYSYFVDASYGAIYPALAKLEADKLVTSRVEQQDGKPAKKIYSLTPLGTANSSIRCSTSSARTNTAANSCCSRALHPSCRHRWSPSGCMSGSNHSTRRSPRWIGSPPTTPVPLTDGLSTTADLAWRLRVTISKPTWAN